MVCNQDYVVGPASLSSEIALLAAPNLHPILTFPENFPQPQVYSRGETMTYRGRVSAYWKLFAVVAQYVAAGTIIPVVLKALVWLAKLLLQLVRQPAQGRWG